MGLWDSVVGGGVNYLLEILKQASSGSFWKKGEGWDTVC